MNTSQFYIELGKRIQTVRINAGYTQQYLADATNVDRPAIARYESGVRKTPLHLLVQFSFILDVSPSDLIPLSPYVCTIKESKISRV